MSGTWMTAHEVAEYLRVSRRTIRDWSTSRGFPTHYIGSNTPRYHREEVDQWVRERGKEASNG